MEHASDYARYGRRLTNAAGYEAWYADSDAGLAGNGFRGAKCLHSTDKWS